MKNTTVTLLSMATRCFVGCQRLRRSFALALMAVLHLGSGIAWATPPVVTMTSPTSTGYYVAPANITVTVSASDVDSTITHVTFYDEFGQIYDTSTYCNLSSHYFGPTTRKPEFEGTSLVGKIDKKESHLYMQGPTYLVPVNEQGNWKSQPDTSAAGRDQA